MKRLACIGDHCVDLYRELGLTNPGGNTVNVAVFLRRLGAEATCFGAVGTDREGEMLLQAAKAKGVDMSHVQILPGKTARTYVDMVEGNRVFTAYDEGVMADFALRGGDLDAICRHDLAVASIWGHVEHEMAGIRARGIPTAMDLADIPDDPMAQCALPGLDIAFFSDDTAGQAAVREKMQAIAAKGPRIVVAMRGAEGSIAWDGQAFYTQGSIPVKVVDTLGAGDSYIAGFLLSWLEGRPIPTCMEAGAKNAAVTIAYQGAW